MVTPTDSPLAREPHKNAVRLLFAAFVVSAIALMVLREVVGEPYPGPFMPAFKGTSLKKESSTEASIILPKMIVTFSDDTTAEISQPTLFGYASSSIHRNLLFMIVPDPDVEADEGLKQKFRVWLSHIIPGYRANKPVTIFTLPDDARDYLRHRLEKIYPMKTPVSLTVTLYKHTFPLAHFHRSTAEVISQSTISFHEGA